MSNLYNEPNYLRTPNNHEPPLTGVSVAFSIGVLLLIHIGITFIFYLCLNMTLRGLGIAQIHFGACFGLWTTWLFITIFPIVLGTNIVKLLTRPNINIVYYPEIKDNE